MSRKEDQKLIEDLRGNVKQLQDVLKQQVQNNAALRKANEDLTKFNMRLRTEREKMRDQVAALLETVDTAFPSQSSVVSLGAHIPPHDLA
jgi:ABC-type transporter Mla subunit MlaD